MRRLSWLLFFFCFIPMPGAAFFPSLTDVQDGLHSSTFVLGSFQADLVCSGYPDFRAGVWFENGRWMTEWSLTHGDEARVVRAAMGTFWNVTRSFGFSSSPPVPWPVYWRTPLDKWLQLGVDGTRMDYTFVHGRPALILGKNATTAETSRPLYWVDNEIRTPLGMAADGVRLFWSEYASVGNIRLPHAATCQMPDGRCLRMEVSWRAVGTDLSDELFDPSAFEAKYGRAVAPALHGEPYDILSTPLF